MKSDVKNLFFDVYERIVILLQVKYDNLTLIVEVPPSYLTIASIPIIVFRILTMIVSMHPIDINS